MVGNFVPSLRSFRASARSFGPRSLNRSTRSGSWSLDFAWSSFQNPSGISLHSLQIPFPSSPSRGEPSTKKPLFVGFLGKFRIFPFFEETLLCRLSWENFQFTPATGVKLTLSSVRARGYLAIFEQNIPNSPVFSRARRGRMGIFWQKSHKSSIYSKLYEASTKAPSTVPIPCLSGLHRNPSCSSTSLVFPFPSRTVLSLRLFRHGSSMRQLLNVACLRKF